MPSTTLPPADAVGDRRGGDLCSFLKKHAVIPNAFIDSFLSMYDPETVQTDLVIDADKASAWLGIHKYTLMQTLRHSYREGIDYSVTNSPRRSPTKKTSGNRYQRVLLTPDCFKRVCMLSRSKRAEEVRTYFISLESLLVRYRSQMLKGMDADIQRLERVTKPKDPADSAGYIYVIRASSEKDSVFKIGRTKDLTKRLATYNTGTADGVEVVFKFRTDSHRATEGCVKAMLQENRYRKFKEVYQADIDMIKQLINDCDGLAKYKRVYTSRKAPKMTGGYYLVLERDPEDVM